MGSCWFDCINLFNWEHKCSLDCVCARCNKTLREHLYDLIREITYDEFNNQPIITDEINFPCEVK